MRRLKDVDDGFGGYETANATVNGSLGLAPAGKPSVTTLLNSTSPRCRVPGAMYERRTESTNDEGCDDAPVTFSARGLAEKMLNSPPPTVKLDAWSVPNVTSVTVMFTNTGTTNCDAVSLVIGMGVDVTTNDDDNVLDVVARTIAVEVEVSTDAIGVVVGIITGAVVVVVVVIAVVTVLVGVGVVVIVAAGVEVSTYALGVVVVMGIITADVVAVVVTTNRSVAALVLPMIGTGVVEASAAEVEATVV
jgi:hypothetical protein